MSDALRYPDILNQYVPYFESSVENPNNPLDCIAKVDGATSIILTDEERNNSNNNNKRRFEPIKLKNGPLIIHEKRWYFRLVSGKKGEYRRSRALMDDYNLNEISKHMVVCFTPDRIPGQSTLFRTKEGNPGRIYAYFDSYLEFYNYMIKFEPNERAFYEVAFGELPQKPHFDIDIDIDDFNEYFPGENIDFAANELRDAVITASIDVLMEKSVHMDLSRDLLIYSSHGPNKRSFHIIINNKCHDGNKEAKAFYDVVIYKIHILTGSKYIKTNFIDKGVYSPRQQFRLVGCQKHGTNRPKIFYEQFSYKGITYTHVYPEDVSDLIIKKLTIIYESMLGFISGCTYLPSFIPPKPSYYNNLDNLLDLSQDTINQCLILLKEKMDYCPFSYKEVTGHYILLKRNAPSYCPICEKIHDAEHPYIFVLNGKVYWDCRRSTEYANGGKLFLGYLAIDFHNDSFPSESIQDNDSDDGEFMFGDFDLGSPTLQPIRSAKNSQPEPPVVESINNINIYIPPPERRQQNVEQNILKIGKEWAQKKYLRREPEDIQGIYKLNTVNPEMPWNAGLN